MNGPFKMLSTVKMPTTVKRLASTFTADKILSAENRARCLKCLHAAPPMGVRLSKSKTEKNFASVLIPICVDSKGEMSILYTRRSGLVSRHVRQISFPGGMKDPQDASFEDCALRETEEEIGLPKSRVELWGTGPLITPPHTAAIMPVYGIVRNLNLDELVLNKDEVDEAIAIPMERLAAPSSFRHTQFKSGYSSPVFIVDNWRIWGITGWLTNNFLHCLLPVEETKKRPKIEYITPYKFK